MPKILIVEDEVNLLSSLKMILTMEGYDVSTAENGEEALELIRNLFKEDSKEFDIVLTDVQMPGINGVELINQIRAMKVMSEILVMTGFGDKNLIVDLLHKGVSGYIDKPFQDSEIIDEVDSLWKNRTRREREESLHINTYETRYMELIDEIQDAKKTFDDIVKPNTDGVPVKLVIKNRPLHDLGGDCFYISMMGDSVAMLIADVSGHDLSASYHTIFLKAFFEEYCRNNSTEPEEFFNRLNKALVKSGMERMITAQFCCWNPQTESMIFLSAGHPQALHLMSEGHNISYLRQENTVLGILKEYDFTPLSIKYKSGDKFIFFTDGLIDLSKIDGETGKKEQFSFARVCEIVNANVDESLETVIKTLWNQAIHFSHYKYSDDLMLIGIETGV